VLYSVTVTLEIWTAIASGVAAFGSLVGALWAGFQIQHHFRYRKPVFKVKRGEFPLRRMPGRPTVVAGGKILLNIRGARWPITLTKREFYYGQTERVTIGHGVEGNLTLAAEVWTLVELEAVGMVFENEPPPFLDAVMYFADDHDFSEKRPLRLELADDRSRYWIPENADMMHMMRTMQIMVPLRRRVTRRVGRALRSLKGLVVKQ